MTLPIVAIVGRPNVGKSTFFNRLIARGVAVIHPEAGVTRDRNYKETDWLGRRFLLVDTGGLEMDGGSSLAEQIRRQVEIAMHEANVICFLLDSRDGILPLDMEIVGLLRRQKKPIVTVINKIDNPAKEEEILSDFYSLGLGKPIGISSLHGLGVDAALDEIISHLDTVGEEEEEEQSSVRVAIVGRPNVGKSSLLNAILGEERVIVDPRPGTTRDSIDTPFNYGQDRFILVDTAGLRRKSRIDRELERITATRAINAIHRSEVVLLVIDAVEGLAEQDKRLLHQIEKAGCAGIVIINKWDLMSGGEELKGQYQQRIKEEMRFIDYLPLHFTSALTMEGLDELMEMIKAASLTHQTRVPTPHLNKIMTQIISGYQPPAGQGKNLKIYYLTQLDIKPPTFLLFVNYPRLVIPQYLRYLQRRMREELNLWGTPIRIKVRKRK
ncbi:MAG: ribosome biogenesis GTPase Der [bacterium]